MTIDVVISNGSNFSQGSTTDPAITDFTLPATEVSLLKGILASSVPLGITTYTDSVPVIDAVSVVKGYQQITSLSAATGLTVPTGSKVALVVPETQDIRWRDDGTNPTATVGMPLKVNAALFYDGSNLSSVKFIEQTSGAKLNVSYYG